MTRAETAKQYFEKGYACSQAVALAFADLTEISESALAKLTLPFGGGMGRLRMTCGAVSGMCAVIGLLFAEDEVSADNKNQTYAMVCELCEKVKNEKGSLICKELLENAELQAQIGGTAEARTEGYYKKRPCGNIVYSVANILEEYLTEKGIV